MSTPGQMIGQTIRRAREQKGLSQTAFGKRIGKSQPDVSRLETGDLGLDFTLGLVIAEVLDISPWELGGRTPRGLDMSGAWWAAWQTWGPGNMMRVDIHPLRIRQDDRFLRLDGSTRARSVEEGSYSWDGKAEIYDAEVVMGEYVATEAAIRSKGTMFLQIHSHGQMLMGGWKGQSYAGLVVDGRAAIARDRSVCEALIGELVKIEGHLTAWPTLNLPPS